MTFGRRMRLQLFAQNAAFTVLLLAAAAMLAVLAQEHAKQWDLTQNARNSLSEGSRQTLQTMSGPVSITAYAPPQDPNLGDIRKRIADFLAPYQRVKPDIKLAFVDPREQPKAAAAANIRVSGEMVVEYQGRSENLTTLDEQSLTNLLGRLARSRERVVMFLEGHGERKPTGAANHDLGDFGQRLQAKGFKVTTLNLAAAQEVPANAAMLVIANPQVDLLQPEVDKIRRHLDNGGNLLWLIDQEPLHGLQPIADLLGLQLAPGIVVDPAASAFQASATLSIGFDYATHPATRDFPLNTAFPLARQIGFAEENTAWRFVPLVRVAQRGWVETGPLNDQVSFDRNRDTPGPVTVVAALSRDVQGREQRVVVTGSGHFLANTYAGLLGNIDLGVNLVNWLAGDENLITVQPRPIVDGALELSPAKLLFLALAFLVALPGAFLFTGATIWWRRRRA
jgi:ABC-type uncharacterized transport system involved in gliding motility auxiliary subunit